MRSMDVGNEGIRSRTLVCMSETSAPGRQCVTALKKRKRWVNESPIIIVVGGKSGLGVRDCGWPVSGREESALVSDIHGK